MKHLALIALALLAGCATTPDRVETARDACGAEYGDDREAFAVCVRLALRKAEARDRAEARRSAAEDRSSQVATYEAMAEVGKSMSAFGASLSRPTVTCTTLGFGSFARTTCR